MLISSKFHDYYDSVTSYGVDKTVVYIRTETEIAWKNKEVSVPYEEKIKWDAKDVTYEVNKYVIGFCGKLYPVIEFRLYVAESGFRSQFFYDVESVKEFMAKRKMQNSERTYFWRENFYVTSETGLKNWFDTARWNVLLPLFHEHKVPVFVFGRDFTKPSGRAIKLVLNPRLKNFQFFKAQDTVTAFQSIYMYISGVLGISAPTTVEISDKEMAKKKGHDSKYSFKKPPGKRGKNKWR
jgi:hypothetical protein